MMIESFCFDIRDGLDHAALEDKRRYVDLLDVRCTSALENRERLLAENANSARNGGR
jgi:hypothetical protein